MTIKLPSRPHGYQYEDYVIACLIALGYFVESRLSLKEGSVLALELDVVATPCDRSQGGPILLEVKSGDWAMKDLFSVVGLKQFLGLDRALLIHRNEARADKVAILSELNKRTSVGHLRLQLPGETENLETHLGSLAPPCVPSGAQNRTLALLSAWWAATSHRVVRAHFDNELKERRQTDVCAEAKRYRDATERSFFATTPQERIEAIYDAYFSSTGVSGLAVNQIVKESGKVLQTVWNEANDTDSHLWVQHLMLLEHRARIAIIKSALDLLEDRAPERIGSALAPSEEGWRRIITFPDNFQRGAEALSKHPHRHCIPYLMQVFVEVFGGFYLVEPSEDLEFIANLTGIPGSEIPGALGLLDVFFPIEKGWFYSQFDGNLHRLKMVPGFVRGAGSFTRQTLYRLKKDKYDVRFPEEGWLLEKWHNTLYAVLEAELGIDLKASA